METQNFFKSKYYKILMPIILVLGIIKLFEAGYYVGQWLFNAIN